MSESDKDLKECIGPFESTDIELEPEDINKNKSEYKKI